MTESRFTIRPAADDDFPTIEDLFASGAWEALPETRRAAIPRSAVLESFRREAGELRGPQSPPNLALVAVGGAGDIVGATWIVGMRSGIDARPTGLVMDLCTAPDTDADADEIAGGLIAAAEEWAQGVGCRALQLGLSPSRSVSIESLAGQGWYVEKTQLGKEL